MSLAVSAATLTVLPDHASGPIEIVQRQGDRLEFVAGKALRPGTLIRVESGSLLWFAEVIALAAQQSNFRILARVEHWFDRSKTAARFATA